MNETNLVPSLSDVKAQAKRLRATLGADGHPINHSQSLELMARQLGCRDWNTLHAAIGNRRDDPPVALGQRVTGAYLGQRFAGEVLGVTRLDGAGQYRVTLHFDDPVDVVTFNSFSAFRQRVSCTLMANGTSPQKTSNGQPQMQIDRR